MMSVSSLFWRYSAAIALVGLALALTLVTPSLAEAPYVLFFGATVFTAWRGGLGPGLFATGLSVLCLDFFFLHPTYALGTGLADSIRLAVFIVVAVFLSTLHEQRRRLEESLRRRDRLRGEHLAVVAHEMRNVLSPMTSALQLLGAAGAGQEVAARSRNVLTRQVGRMTRLIDDLIDAASAEQGKLRLCTQPMDLRAVVVSTVESMRPDIEGRGHRLEVYLPGQPVVVEGDPSRLEQIIVNLLGNAAKYTDSGGYILLSVQPVGSEARLCVRDSGIGLSAEVLARIFELFAQAEGGPRGGLGIGLSLARQLARLHGGDLVASSEGAGRGCEFVLRLPLALVDEQVADQRTLSPTGPLAIAAALAPGEKSASR
jgi:signal transduction histidine kinase